MTRNILSISAIALACCISLPASAVTSKNAYKADVKSASDAYEVDRKQCNSLSGNGKDVCVAEAKAKEKRAKADAEFAHVGTVKAQREASEDHAAADYDVAVTRCDAKTGNDKDVCVKEAKAVKVKADADAKLNKTVADSAHDANSDKNEADYKVAKEKCDSLAGDAKSSCVATAKQTYQK